MATLRQIFTKMANDVKKYPNIVQLTKTLDEGFKEVAENISGGGGGGSTVSVTQTQISGNKIGTVTVDGVGTGLYAPKATLSLSGTGNRTLTLNTQVTGGVDASAVELPVGDTVSYVASQESGTLIGTLTINNVSSLLYAPTPQTPIHTYSTTEQVVGKWIDGTTDVYEVVHDEENSITIQANDWGTTTLSNANIAKIISISCINPTGACFQSVGVNNDTGSYVHILNARGTAINVKTFIIRYIKTS